MSLEFDMSQLENVLQDLENKVKNEICDSALTEGAKIMLREQQQQVPVDTGALKNSLGIDKIKGTKTNKKVNIGIQNAKRREVIYGYYQEYGTANMVGKKWMKKSFQNSIDDVNRKIKQTIKEELLSR